jgi:hypothetical protein
MDEGCGRTTHSLSSSADVITVTSPDTGKARWSVMRMSGCIKVASPLKAVL